MLFAHILEKTTWIMLLNRDHHLDINVLIGFMKVVCKDILSRHFLSSRGASPPGALFTAVIKIHPRVRGCHVHHNQSVLYLKSSGRNWPLPDIWVLANATPRWPTAPYEHEAWLWYVHAMKIGPGEGVDLCPRHNCEYFCQSKRLSPWLLHFVQKNI